MLWKFVRSNGVSSSPSLYKTVILGSCSNMSICLLFGALLLTVLNRDNVSEMSRVYSLWKWKRSVIFSLKIQPKRSGGGPDLRTSGSFLGRRLPSQTNTSFFCTICPHTWAPENNFLVSHSSLNCTGSSTLNLGVLSRSAFHDNNNINNRVQSLRIPKIVETPPVRLYLLAVAMQLLLSNKFLRTVLCRQRMPPDS